MLFPGLELKYQGVSRWGHMLFPGLELEYQGVSRWGAHAIPRARTRIPSEFAHLRVLDRCCTRCIISVPEYAIFGRRTPTFSEEGPSPGISHLVHQT